MNFLDLAQQNAAGAGSAPAAGPAPEADQPSAAGANVFGISAEELARQQEAMRQAQAAQEAQKTAAPAPVQKPVQKPAAPSVTGSSATERRKDGSQVEKAVADGIYVLTFHGEFDETNVDKEFDRIEKFFGPLPHKLAVFDFRDVQYVNSKTMGYIADWYQRFTDAGGEISIAHGGAVLDSLEACGITQLVQVAADVGESVKILRAKFPEHVKEGVSSAHEEAPAAPAAPAASAKLPSAADLLSAAAPAPVAKVEIRPGAPVGHMAAVPVTPAAAVQAAEAVSPAVPGRSDVPAQVKVEQLSPVVSPSGIRDSDGKTFVFYEKASPAAALAPAPVPSAPSVEIKVTEQAVPAMVPPESIKPGIEEIVEGAIPSEEGVTLANAHEIVAAAPVQEDTSEAELLAAAQEFGGIVNAKAKEAKAAVSTPAPAAQPARKPVQKPAAQPARKPVASRARKGKRLFLAVAALAAAGAAAFQFAGPSGVSDVLSSVTQFVQEKIGSAPAQEAAPEEIKPVLPKPAAPRVRPRRPAAPAASPEAPVPAAQSAR